ncbi:MAG: manganese catalase family protein [Clostridiales bacterium]|nr:manganese catalase family protein [Clostridiales bacterium]
MWSYERRLQHPVNITQCNPKLAQVIISQFGGPDGELAASMRYISQMYSMSTTNRKVAGLLLDIGTEELGHMEMIGAIVHQLTRDLSPQQIVESGFDKYYVDHTLGLYHVAASGTPFTASYYQSKGDPITDLIEDMAAEQKARTTYDNILRLVHDQEVCDPIRFLREREIVHFQRFGEALRMIQDELDSKNFYAFNPSFDKAPCK